MGIGGSGRTGGRSLALALAAPRPLEPRVSPRWGVLLAASLALALFLVGARSGVERRRAVGLGLLFEAFFWDDLATVFLVSSRQLAQYRPRGERCAGQG